MVDEHTLTLVAADTVLSLRLDNARVLMERICAVRDRQADADTAASMLL